MKLPIPTKLLKLGLIAVTPCVLLAGCTTSSKDGSIAAAGLVYEQRGESSAKLDGEQIAKIAEEAAKLTLGGQAGTLMNTVKDIATGAEETASQAADTASKADNNASRARDDAADAKKEAVSSRTKADELATQLGITKAELDSAAKALGRLDPDTKVKLENQINELAKFRDDRSKFDEKLQDTLTGLKLTAAQSKEFMEKTKGMTPTEILAILGSAAGAATAGAGVGGVLGKTGKSRAQPQIEKLEKTVTDLQHTTLKRGDIVTKAVV
jgi:hypothetical protein